MEGLKYMDNLGVISFQEDARAVGVKKKSHCCEGSGFLSALVQLTPARGESGFTDG